MRKELTALPVLEAALPGHLQSIVVVVKILRYPAPSS